MAICASASTLRSQSGAAPLRVFPRDRLLRGQQRRAGAPLPRSSNSSRRHGVAEILVSVDDAAILSPASLAELDATLALYREVQQRTGPNICSILRPEFVSCVVDGLPTLVPLGPPCVAQDWCADAISA